MDTISLLSRGSGQGRKETKLRVPHRDPGIKTLKMLDFDTCARSKIAISAPIIKDKGL